MSCDHLLEERPDGTIFCSKCVKEWLPKQECACWKSGMPHGNGDFFACRCKCHQTKEDETHCATCLCWSNHKDRECPCECHKTEEKCRHQIIEDRHCVSCGEKVVTEHPKCCCQTETMGTATLRNPCPLCPEHGHHSPPTGLCSAHKYGENTTCQVCYPSSKQSTIAARPHVREEKPQCIHGTTYDNCKLCIPLDSRL